MQVLENSSTSKLAGGRNRVWPRTGQLYNFLVEGKKKSQCNTCDCQQQSDFLMSLFCSTNLLFVLLIWSDSSPDCHNDLVCWELSSNEEMTKVQLARHWGQVMYVQLTSFWKSLLNMDGWHIKVLLNDSSFVGFERSKPSGNSELNHICRHLLK